jgi:hypothetical protein
MSTSIPEPYFDNELQSMVHPVTINVLVSDGKDVFEKSYGITEWGQEITHWRYMPAPPIPSK